MHKTSPALLVVTYHYIRDPESVRYPGIHPVSMDRLRDDLERMGKAATFATPSEAELFLRGLAEFDGPRVLVTFDDGLIDHWHAARDVLEPRGIKAAFFVSSRPMADRRALLVNKLQYVRSITPPEIFRRHFYDHVPPEAGLLARQPAFRKKACDVYIHDHEEDACVKYLANFSLGFDDTEHLVDELLAHRSIDEGELCEALYMRPDHLRRLHADGHLIACHGHTHRPLGAMRDAEMDADVSACQEALHWILGERPGWISFPYGRGDAIPRDPGRLCDMFGFRVALTLSPDWNLPGQDPLRVRRVTENQYTALLENVPHVSGIGERRVA
ncbi:MAG: polysaccharide deacetylase family protein [Alphaproteobacteria bacterium]|nr:polysaccharide deacetylase family protein [Alphaproteobacteria bacterium]